MRRFSKGFRIGLYVAGAVVLVAAGFIFQLLHAAGQFKTLEPHFSGSCTPVAGIHGAEDITIHPRTGVAYISAANRRSMLAGGPGHGGIYAYDLKLDSPQLQDLTPAADEDFHPHGVSLYVSEDGRDVLYVINHARGRHTIEIYDLVGMKDSEKDQVSSIK